MQPQTNPELPLFEPAPLTEIVLSLQDTAYELIQSGAQKLEFRMRWRNGPCMAYIYRSGRVKELSACMKLGAPIFGTPGETGRLAEEMRPGYGASVAEYLLSTQERMNS